MFEKVLVANWGKTALRVVRDCQELGVSAVAVYLYADVTTLHVSHADESVNLHRSPATAT